MATTANTVFPIQPQGGVGGLAASPISTIPCEPGSIFAPGDCIVIDATTKDAIPGNTQATTDDANNVLGFAMCKAFTAEATIDRDGIINEDIVNVALATPGARFQGNVVATATGDETGVYADNVRVEVGLVEADGDTTCALGLAGATAFTLEYLSPQYDKVGADWQYGREAGVGILNPRVVFVMYATATVFSYQNQP